MINSKNSRAVFTNLIGNTRYAEPSWWRVDNDNNALAGPRTSKRKLAESVAGINSLIKSGEYLDRP